MLGTQLKQAFLFKNDSKRITGIILKAVPSPPGIPVRGLVWRPLEDLCAHHHSWKLLPQKGLCVGVKWGAPGWAGKGRTVGDGGWGGEPRTGSRGADLALSPGECPCRTLGTRSPTELQRADRQVGSRQQGSVMSCFPRMTQWLAPGL